MKKSSILRLFILDQVNPAPFFKKTAGKKAVEALWKEWLSDPLHPERFFWNQDLASYQGAFKELQKEARKKLRRRVGKAIRQYPSLLRKLGRELIDKGWIRGLEELSYL